MQAYRENVLREVITPGHRPRINYRRSGVVSYG